ncbi:MAG: hypothetical protein MZW92_23550 [Comamonadaceae bacterium]|nr:hypothetical protein [Comamonadaceae bacterium]
MAVLRPLISPNNTINANPGNNSLVITDYADNLQRIGKIIAALDQPPATDVEIMPLQHARGRRPGAAGAAPGRRRRRRRCPACQAAPAARQPVIADSRSNCADRARRQPGAAGAGARASIEQARPARRRAAARPATSGSCT